MGKIILKAFVSALLVLAASQAWADGHGVNCARFAPGSVVLPPPDIFSQNGALNVQLNYFTRVDHCHILGHEDGGMMAIIRVLAPSS